MEKTVILTEEERETSKLNISKIEELEAGAVPYFDKLESLRKEAEAILKGDKENPAIQKRAKEIRIEIKKKVRTEGVDVWHQAEKEESSRIITICNLIKNKLNAKAKKLEEDLEKIEKYAEEQRKKKEQELIERRKFELGDLLKYLPPMFNLSLANDQEFEEVKKFCEFKKNEEDIQQEKAKAEAAKELAKPEPEIELPPIQLPPMETPKVESKDKEFLPQEDAVNYSKERDLIRNIYSQIQNINIPLFQSAEGKRIAKAIEIHISRLKNEIVQISKEIKDK